MASCNIAFTSVACYTHTFARPENEVFCLSNSFCEFVEETYFLALLYLHMPFLYLSRVFLPQLSAASLSDKDGKIWKDKG
jgi:hypothetical protein